MSETTNLKLYKHDNPVSSTNQFNVNKSLNENWDKIDEEIGQKRIEIAKLEEENIDLKAENERLKQDLNALPSGQAEGETIDITDSAEMRFSEFNVRGNSRQESSTEGNNKFDSKKVSYYTRDSRETYIINSSNSITVSGANMSWSRVAITIKNLKPSTKYTMSAKVTNASNHNAGLLVQDDNNTVNHISTNTNFTSKITFVTDSNGSITIQVFSNWTGTSLSESVTYDDIQLEEGETATEYEKFTPNMPSPDYPSEVESCGDNVNLFDVEASTEFIDCTKNDDEILTQVGKSNPVIVNSGLTFKAGKYLMSLLAKKNNGTYSSGFSSVQFLTGNSIALTKVQNPIISEEYQKYIFSFDLETETTFGRILLQLNSNPQSVISIKNIKIEKGTKSTPYTPYGQGCINEVVCNKNLCPKPTKTASNGGLTYTPQEDGSIKVTGTATGYSSYTLIPNSMKFKPKADFAIYLGNPKNIVTQVNGYDENGNVIKDLMSATTVDISDYPEVDHWRISIKRNSNVETNTTVYPMIYYSDKANATEYVPHQSQTFTIPTQQPMRAIGDIRDTFVKVDGKWFERHNVNRIIFDGTENWTKTDTTNYYTYNLEVNNMIYGPDTGVISDIKSSHFPAKTLSDLWNGITGIGMFPNQNRIRITYVSDNTDTLDKWKTYLAEQYNAGTPVYVDYILATPTDIQCTPEQSAILDNLENTVKTYKGGTHIYSTDEVAPNVEVTYKKDIETLFNNLTATTVAEGE